MPHAPDVATRSARMMMADAVHSVTKAHTGLTRHYLSSTAMMAIASLTMDSRGSIGTGLPSSAGVPIAGLVTGGLAIPVLLRLGGEGWPITKALEEIGQQEKRADRHWLRRLPGAAHGAEADHDACLKVEASDALRRAMDHYQAMAGIGAEVKAAEAAPLVTCEEALNHIKAVARFIRHGDKVRNYLLPVLDLLVFYTEEYQELAKVWAVWEASLQAALQAWFESHAEHSCAPGGGARDVCYAPLGGMRNNRMLYTVPAKRHADVRTPIPPAFAPVPAAAAPPGAVEIDTLLAGMRQARARLLADMQQSDSVAWNYGAERPAAIRVADSTPAAMHMHKIRLDAMLDAVWKQVDRPGYFAHGAHRAGHWFSRHSTSEKANAVIGELSAVGSVFLPATQGANALTDTGRHAISGTASGAARVREQMDQNLLRGAGGVPIRSGLVDHTLIEAPATEEIHTAAAGLQNMLPKLMLHFGRAAAALAALGDAPPVVKSCNDAMALCTKAAEIVSQMEKASRYAGPCLGMVDVLAAQCHDWTRKESAMWRHMEMRVGEWLRDDEVHQTCRHDSKKCYGAKHRRSGANLLGRGGTWAPITNDPHNPLT